MYIRLFVMSNINSINKNINPRKRWKRRKWKDLNFEIFFSSSKHVRTSRVISSFLCPVSYELLNKMIAFPHWPIFYTAFWILIVFSLLYGPLPHKRLASTMYLVLSNVDKPIEDAKLITYIRCTFCLYKIY